MTLLADIVDDLDTMFDEDDFAEDGVLNINGVDQPTVRVIMNRPYQVANMATGEAENTAPECLIRNADIIGIQQGDTITVTDPETAEVVIFDVVEVQPGKHGMSNLILSEDARHG